MATGRESTREVVDTSGAGAVGGAGDGRRGGAIAAAGEPERRGGPGAEGSVVGGVGDPEGSGGAGGDPAPEAGDALPGVEVQGDGPGGDVPAGVGDLDVTLEPAAPRPGQGEGRRARRRSTATTAGGRGRAQWRAGRRRGRQWR